MDADQRIGFFRTGRDHAARAVIFEGATDQMHAIGKQGRCERVAAQPLEGLAVEGETNGIGLAKPTGGGDAEGLGHHLPSPPRSGFGSPAL